MKRFFFNCCLLLIACAVSATLCAQVAGKEVTFTKYHLWDEFYSEGVTVGDVNNDGKTDIIAGARWFEAPEWKAHDIWKHKKFFYTKGYSDSFLNYSADLNEDGWVDLICFDFPGREVYWFENPKGGDNLWKRHLIDSVASNESPMFVDIDSNGKKDLVFGNEKIGQLAWFSYSVAGNKVEWTRHPISEKNAKGIGLFSHGLGWGDINGDGVKDVMIIGGWWEAPRKIQSTPWKFHETGLGEPCAQMIAYDLDNDGDNDVVTSSAHDYGLWWHEQGLDAEKKIRFTTHTIDTTFSELHSIVMEDINKDGLPDFVTGKRYYSHQGKGPGGQEPGVLYWFEMVKDGKQRPVWIRHLVDDLSGVGIQFVVEDMNKDGKPDIIISNKNGVFYFEQD